MHTSPPPPRPNELLAHIEQALAQAGRPGGSERLLKQLQRLEPTAHRALSQTRGAVEEDFGATLRDLRCLP
jgi:hypothetical protein